MVLVEDLAQQRQNERLEREYQQQLDNYNRRVAARQQELERLRSIGSSFVPPDLGPPPEVPAELIQAQERAAIRAKQQGNSPGAMTQAPLTVEGMPPPDQQTDEDRQLLEMIRQFNNLN